MNPEQTQKRSTLSRFSRACAVWSLIPRWVLPIYMTADRVFKSSHGHVWLQQVQTLVRVAVPVCAGEVLDHRLLSGEKTLQVLQCITW